MKPVRRTRLEKLMDARIRAVRATNKIPDKYVMNVLHEAIDYLFYEVDILIREVEDLKRETKKGKK